MKSVVLVTGGTGFVGSHCVAQLLTRDDIGEVRTTLRSKLREQSMRDALSRAGVPHDKLRCFEADLSGDAGWSEAIAGASHVLHVASPLGGNGETLEQLLPAARDGSLRILHLCVTNKVRRVVVTSSCATTTPRVGSSVTKRDESVHSELDDPQWNAYAQSKIATDQAVWAFARDYPTLQVVSLHPAAVIGPTLLRDSLGSVQLVSRMLSGEMPRIPNVGFQFVDVRDVAAAHLTAAFAANPAGIVGERYILASEWHHLDDISAVLRQHLAPAESVNVPTGRMPSFVIRLASWFMADLRSIVNYLDLPKPTELFSSDKARHALAWRETPFEQSVVDCAKSLL